ncbi:MAG TPA: FG-GAP repeat protein [Dokdonella sp.]
MTSSDRAVCASFSRRLLPALLAFAAIARAGTLAWPEQEAVAGDGTARSMLGRAAVIVGDTAFVGAPGAAAGGAVYVYLRGTDGWTQTQELHAAGSADGADFGISIALSADTAIIGADRTTLTQDSDRHQGAAYVFSRGDDGSWTETQQLVASDYTSEALFGNAVALSGSTVLIGSYNASVGDNPYQGAAYVFSRGSDGAFSETQKLVAEDGAGGDDFGNALALDGTRAIIGAFYGSGVTGQSGAAYVFENGGGTWTQTAKLAADDGAFFDTFGNAVALSGDLALIAAPSAQVGDSYGQGAIYAFRLADGDWTQTQKIVAADGAEGDGLGGSIALSGTRVLAGASSAMDYAGAAFAFERDDTGTWNELGRLLASDGLSGDGYGSAVALSADAALVGAPLRTVGANAAQGAAYFYAPPTDDRIFADGFEAAP